jgi:hypothetical protein
VSGQAVISPANEMTPAAPIEYRSSNVANVNYSQRIIEFITVLYDEGAVWSGAAKRGERFSVGVRGTVLKSSPGGVNANRDHDKTRTVGKIVNFGPPAKKA